MATILFAWELGEGLGHVQRLLRVARPLAAEGHQPVFALCDVAESWPLFQQDRFPVLQSPYWNFRPRRATDPPFLASSLADVLCVRGWESVDTLAPLVEAWQRLLDYVRPALIVTDFAPTLCLAAFGSTPVVQVGSWFAMAPADGATFPILVPGRAPLVPQDELLRVACDVQGRRERPLPSTLPAILAAGDRFPTFFVELDPYQACRTEATWDPLEPMPSRVEAAPKPRFFAYLTAVNPSVEPFLTQMALTGVPGDVYLRSAPPPMKERLRLQGLQVRDEPAKIDEVLKETAVVVHHGGSMANMVFAAGRPQILLPQHLEQATTAHILGQLGVALTLQGNASPDAAGRALKQVLTEKRFADKAAECARRLHARPRRPGLPAILECCRTRLASA